MFPDDINTILPVIGFALSGFGLNFEMIHLKRMSAESEKASDSQQA